MPTQLLHLAAAVVPTEDSSMPWELCRAPLRGPVSDHGNEDFSKAWGNEGTLLLLIDLFNLWGKSGNFSEVSKVKSHRGKFLRWLARGECLWPHLPHPLATPLLAEGDTTLFPVTLFPLISPAFSAPPPSWK